MENSEEAIKRVELELLDIFISICKKIQAKYYVVGGTLLGAVRHKGFIPWDDDIDVGMLRKDYDLFLQHAPEFLPDNVFLQTYETDRNYLSCMAKLRMNNTTFIEKSVQNVQMHHGVFIDIFPFDYYRDSKWQNIKYKVINKLVISRLAIEYQKSQETTDIGFKEKFLMKISNKLYPNTIDALRVQNKLMKSISYSTKVRNYCGAWGLKEIWSLSWFGCGEELEFEGRYVAAPKEWHLFLSQIYGDYMTLPPIEDRITHHHTAVIDCEKSYTNYMKK